MMTLENSTQYISCRPLACKVHFPGRVLGEVMTYVERLSFDPIPHYVLCDASWRVSQMQRIDSVLVPETTSPHEGRRSDPFSHDVGRASFDLAEKEGTQKRQIPTHVKDYYKARGWRGACLKHRGHNKQRFAGDTGDTLAGHGHLEDVSGRAAESTTG